MTCDDASPDRSNNEAGRRDATTISKAVVDHATKLPGCRGAFTAEREK